MIHLKELLSSFQKEVTDFDPVLIYFKSKLNSLSRGFNLDIYKSDLLVFLWQITSNIDLSKFDSDRSLSSYISLSLKRCCISLYHKQVTDKKVMYNSSLTDIELDKNYSYVPTDESLLIFNDLIYNLPQKQKNIITLRYDHCLSDNEIANQLNISRQAVCKNRNLALNKIKKSLLN